MNRQEILEFINKVIEEEHGNVVEEDQLLIDCGIDSFGYALLWASIEGEFKQDLGKKIMSSVDYSVFTVKDMIDMIVGDICS